MSKDMLKELVMLPLQRPELFCKGQMTKPCKGILLIDPPRTGKTMLAKAVANFSNVSLSSITSKWFGEGGEYVKAVFSLASKIAPSVIFADEVDSMLGRRVNPGEHEAMRKMKNEFMVNWDGLRTKDTERALVLTPTNRPFDLDEAVIRRIPHRFEPQQAPLTLTVRTDASWSSKIATWFVSVLIIDSRQTIVFCRCFLKVEDPDKDPISFQGELYGFCCAMMIVQKMSLSHLLDPPFAAVKFISDSKDLVEQINGLEPLKDSYEKLPEMSGGLAAWNFLHMQKFEVELQHLDRKFNKFSDEMARLVRLKAEKDCYRRGKDILFREGYYTNINGMHVIINGINVEDGGLDIATLLPDEVKKKYNIQDRE